VCMSRSLSTLLRKREDTGQVAIMVGPQRHLGNEAPLLNGSDSAAGGLDDLLR